MEEEEEDQGNGLVVVVVMEEVEEVGVLQVLVEEVVYLQHITEMFLLISTQVLLAVVEVREKKMIMVQVEAVEAGMEMRHQSLTIMVEMEELVEHFLANNSVAAVVVVEVTVKVDMEAETQKKAPKSRVEGEPQNMEMEKLVQPTDKEEVVVVMEVV
jgi:hypothetical protein